MRSQRRFRKRFVVSLVVLFGLTLLPPILSGLVAPPARAQVSAQPPKIRADALPVLQQVQSKRAARSSQSENVASPSAPTAPDRKSTRLNSSHPSISYAVFCLK